MANDRFILVSGTVNNFHTDSRIFNPSYDKDIDISATFLPAGNVDNTGETAVTIHVPKRDMKILDDVVTAVFNRTGIGAIRLTSNDDFEVTSRIYAQTAAGTLGQFGTGLPSSAARARGALLQLKSSTNFRTNIGAVNPNTTPATITWTFYDHNNAVIGTNQTTLAPLGVLGPTNLASGAFVTAQNVDLSDAWVSYSTSGATPVLVYASVVDNGTTDPTLIASVDDTGTPPPAQSLKSFDVTEQSFSIDISPDPSTLRVGDQAVFHVRNLGGAHGFTLVAPDGQQVIPSFAPVPGGAAVDKTFTVQKQGTYTYFCTNPGCGGGHGQMNGSFNVSSQAGPPDTGY